MCLTCERKGRKSAPRLCSETFRMVCQNCGDDPDCIPPIDVMGRIVTVQSKQLFFAPCCAAIREYTGSGQDFANCRVDGNLRECQHTSSDCRGSKSSSSCRKPRHTCAAWNCQAHALAKQHLVLDHVECQMDTYYLCHKHTPPEDWLRRVKNFRQFSATCRDWEMKVRSSHKR